MNQIRIGWASRDISTTLAVNIPGQGYRRISQGIMDPVTLTALAVDNGSDQVIFLSADLVAVHDYLLDDIRDQVRRLDPAVPVQKILMHVTHTHTGPGFGRLRVDSAPDPAGDKDHGQEYRAFLVDQAAAAVVEAYRGRREGGIAYGYGYAVVSHNRRVVYFDDTSLRPGKKEAGFFQNGHGVMYGDTKDKNFSHYEGGADHFVNLLFTFDGQDELTGAIINLAATSQNSELENRLSADFWHDVRQQVRQEFGDIFILPQCAPAGDLSPRILHYNAAQARRFQLKFGLAEADTELAARKDIALRITEAFREVFAWAKKDIQKKLELEHKVVTVQLKKRLVTDEELDLAKKLLAELDEQALAGKDAGQARRRFSYVIQRHKEQDKEPRQPMEMHVLRIGDVAFASNRFELFVDYMHRIQARSPFVQTFVIQLAGTAGPYDSSYLATERGVANKGYSANLFGNLVSPQGGQNMVEKTLEILHGLKAGE